MRALPRAWRVMPVSLQKQAPTFAMHVLQGPLHHTQEPLRAVHVAQESTLIRQAKPSVLRAKQASMWKGMGVSQTRAHAQMEQELAMQLVQHMEMPNVQAAQLATSSLARCAQLVMLARSRVQVEPATPVR